MKKKPTIKCQICKSYKKCKKICHCIIKTSNSQKYCLKPLKTHKKCSFCEKLWHLDNHCSCSKEKTIAKIKHYCYICNQKLYDHNDFHRYLTRGNICLECSSEANRNAKKILKKEKEYKDYIKATKNKEYIKQLKKQNEN